MAEVISLEGIIAIIGVIGTWIGVYLGYKAIKKDNKKMFNQITTLINSNNKINTQVGRRNTNVQ